MFQYLPLLIALALVAIGGYLVGTNATTTVGFLAGLALLLLGLERLFMPFLAGMGAGQQQQQLVGPQDGALM